MVSQKVTIHNPVGLHLRPAGILCQEAMRYSCRVKFRYGRDGENTANCKSILSILGARIRPGDEIELICDGTDEIEAMHALISLIADGLGDNTLIR